MDKFKKGDTFIREKTGSATMINLDGKSSSGNEDNLAIPDQIPVSKEPKRK
ncbi:MAG: hypothetical protein PHO01_02230 [Desulfotomaculaceae bacterium]|nr:hypothetical protein [Desulfotomaculaceae bacterium]